MTIHRCDRCKKDVGLSSEFYELEIGNIHNIFSIKHHIQLCEDCVKALDNWVRQESANDGGSDAKDGE